MTQDQLSKFVERLDLCHDMLDSLAMEIFPLERHMNKAVFENAYTVCIIAKQAVYAARRQYDTDDFRLAVQTYKDAQPETRAQIVRLK